MELRGPSPELHGHVRWAVSHILCLGEGLKGKSIRREISTMGLVETGTLQWDRFSGGGSFLLVGVVVTIQGMDNPIETV